MLGWLLAPNPATTLLPWHEADLPAAAADALAELAATPPEVVRVGVALAYALGHSEFAHIDDHTAVSLPEQLPADGSSTDQNFQAQVRSGLDPRTAERDGGGQGRTTARADQLSWVGVPSQSGKRLLATCAS